MRTAILVVSVVALLTAVLWAALQWHVQSEPIPIERNDATRRALENSAAIPAAAAIEPESPTIAPATTPAAEAAPEVSRAATPAGIGALVAGIDPQLRDKNMIMRPPRLGQLIELEQRFNAESADASWSSAMEARILDQVSQVAGLKLVTLDAECRATICRVKLFHPPGTNALSELDKVNPIANEIGLSHVLEAATIGADGVPISLLYFQREGA